MVKKAKLKDIKAIHKLIESFALKGEMLHRTIVELHEQLRDFFVFVDDNDSDAIIGVAALSLAWDGLAEVRSLSVKEGHTGKGVGKALAKACIAEARSLGLKKIFALTYSVGFFEKLGFMVVDKEVLPHKIWNDCVKCVKFPNCDETAVMMDL